MTFSPLPKNPSELYGIMDVETLAAHLNAVVAALQRAGVEINVAARDGLDEIEQSIVEHFGRTDPAALRRHLSVDQAAALAPAPTGRRH